MFSPLIERIDTEGSVRDECMANWDAPVQALVESMNISNSQLMPTSLAFRFDVVCKHISGVKR